MPEPHDQRVRVFDAEGRAVGARPREEAKCSGLAVGAVNVLLVNARGKVLLQRGPEDKENGGRWDKSVGGHVNAGEGFDQAAVRETGEELFSDPRSPRVRLVAAAEDFAESLSAVDPAREVVLRREAFQRNLRDVRRGPDGSVRNVVYHVASYLGRTDVRSEGFRPPGDEIAGLRWARPAEVGALLLRHGYSPAFGARPLKRTVERFVLLPVAHAVARGGAAPGSVLRLVARGDAVVVETSPMSRKAV